MLSKGSVVSLPLVILLLVWWLHGRVTIRHVLEMFPFLCIAAVLGLVNAWYQLHGDPVAHASFPTRLAGAGAVIWFYLSKALIASTHSCLIIHSGTLQTNDLQWWLPLLAAIVVTATLIYQQRSTQSKWSRAFLFAWSFFLFSACCQWRGLPKRAA